MYTKRMHAINQLTNLLIDDITNALVAKYEGQTIKLYDPYPFSNDGHITNIVEVIFDGSNILLTDNRGFHWYGLRSFDALSVVPFYSVFTHNY